MSSFSRQGKRKAEEGTRRTYKLRHREYLRLIAKFKEIADELNKDVEFVYTENNIQEKASPLLGRELDSMEVFFLMTNLNNIKIEEDVKTN